MKHDIFSTDEGRTLCVITDWEDKKPSKKEAIRYAANNYFKCKKELLIVKTGWMSNKKAKMLYLNPIDDYERFYVVLKKRKSV